MLQIAFLDMSISSVQEIDTNVKVLMENPEVPGRNARSIKVEFYFWSLGQVF